MDILRTDEITQILAYVESRPHVDKIAISGLSLGAKLAADQSIINNDVIDAAILASGAVTVLYSPLHTEYIPANNQVSCCDTLDQIATIAPMPVYVSFGMQESPFFRWHAETEFVKEFLADAYELHDKSENLNHFVHDGKHGYHIPSVLTFLRTHVGN